MDSYPLAGRPAGRVGYGAMQLEFRGRIPDRPAAIGLLRRARELGVNHIDTAEFYGAGAVNELIRAALHPYGDDLVLATKIGAVHTAGGLVAAQRPEQLREQVEANQRSLGTDHLPLVTLRRLDTPPGIVASGDQRVDLDAQLAELVRLREKGVIGAIGLGSVGVEQLRQAEPVGVAAVQNLFHLLDRSEQPVLAECAAAGVAFVPFFPLGSAFPGRPKVVDHPVVRAVAERLGATPAQVGLAWLLAQGEHVLLIAGTTSSQHLAENVAAGDLNLDERSLAELDAIAG